MIALTAVLTAVPIAAFADDADLEARIAALEERVTALEAQLSGSGASNPTSEADETEVPDERVLEINGARLAYDDLEVTKDFEGDDCLVLYFNFSNDSDLSLSFVTTYFIKVFQNGIEQDFSSGPEGMSELTFDNAYREIRAGAGPLRVAYCSKITDTSNVIVNITGYVNSEECSTEFTLSLE